MSPRPTPQYARALVWMRRDLRAHDHAALYHALKHAREVFVAFVFDTDILADLPADDRRVSFIHASLRDLHRQLQALKPDAGLLVSHGAAGQTIPELARALRVDAVFTNHDVEPQAKARDAQVLGALAHHDIVMHSFKDQSIFERDEVLTQSGRPYTVFTPYKKAWLAKLNDFYVKPYPVARHAAALATLPHDLPAHTRAAEPGWLLAEMGFEAQDLAQLHIQTGTQGARALLADFILRMDLYEDTRDFPAIKGPSYLSVHLRFGTLSIRELVGLAWARAREASAGAQTWLSELIWRDFYMQILEHFPHAAQHAFKHEYERIQWAHGPQAKQHFQAWCDGQTGYPLVDAAMHQLNRSGYMHNRLRMVVASFLTKDLGLDWRWGEAYFAEKLIDFDLAANNGGWQWAASSGCDAQPYFRIFNPITQSQKFDPKGKFIRRYLPQLAGLSDKAIHAPWLAAPLELQAAGVRLGEDYPAPVVDHAQARADTLARYAVVKTSTPTVIRHTAD